MENVKYIKLSNYDAFAIVDEELYESLCNHKWRVEFYKGRRKRVSRQSTKKDLTVKNKIFLHHAIIKDVPPGMVIDHINQDVLDNRKINLRVCTVRENSLNKRPHKNNRSQYKGVSIRKLKDGRLRYEARIYNKGVCICLGTFDTAEKAAMAYNEKATELFGKYAYLNVIPEKINNAEIQTNQ